MKIGAWFPRETGCVSFRERGQEVMPQRRMGLFADALRIPQPGTRLIGSPKIGWNPFWSSRRRSLARLALKASPADEPEPPLKAGK